MVSPLREKDKLNNHWFLTGSPMSTVESHRMIGTKGTVHRKKCKPKCAFLINADNFITVVEDSLEWSKYL